MKSRFHSPVPGRIKRATVIVAAGVVLSLGLSACSGASSSATKSASPDNQKVTLNFAWWGDATRAAVTNQALNDFEKIHPNITVTTSYAGYGPYWQKIATQTAGGAAPDVFQMDLRYLRQYGSSNSLLDLGKESSVLSTKGMDPSLASSGKLDGRTLAVPFGQTISSIVLDNTILQGLGMKPFAGGSWSDFAAWAKSVSSASGGKVYGVNDMGWAEDVFEVWLGQHGKTLYNNGKLGFTQEDLTTFWTMWQNLVKDGAATPSGISNKTDGTTTNSPLISKQAAADFIAASGFVSYTQATTDNLSLIAFPKDGSKSGQYYKSSMLLSGSAKTAHPEQAAELINYLANNETAGIALGVNRGLPPNLTVRDTMLPILTGASKQVADYEASLKSAVIGTPSAPVKGDGQVQTLLQSTYQALTSGQTSMSQAVSQFFTQAQQAIGE